MRLVSLTSLSSHSLEDEKAELLLTALAQGHDIRVLVQGTSMLPFIVPGSTVIISPCKPNLLLKGDIILTVRKKQTDEMTSLKYNWVIHRVVMHDREKKLIITGGDRLPINDDPQPYHEIRGIISQVLYPKYLERSLIHICFLFLVKRPHRFYARLLGLFVLYLYRVYAYFKNKLTSIT